MYRQAYLGSDEINKYTLYLRLPQEYVRLPKSHSFLLVARYNKSISKP